MTIGSSIAIIGIWGVVAYMCRKDKEPNFFLYLMAVVATIVISIASTFTA